MAPHRQRVDERPDTAQACAVEGRHVGVERPDVAAAGIPACGAVGERDQLEAGAAAAVESLLLLRRELAGPLQTSR